MSDQAMYYPIIDAPINKELELIKVKGESTRKWLRHLGLFEGANIIRHGDDVQYRPVRVRGTLGDVVVPSGFGIKTIVHLDYSDTRCPLTEMPRKSRGHIETIAGGVGVREGLKTLGLVEDGPIHFVRTLPHMDYVTIINHRQRTRLSEGEAAKIWGEYNGNKKAGIAGQFYFSRKGEEFVVRGILGGRQSEAHLASHGVQKGDKLYVETVEQAQEVHRPIASPIVVSGSGGLRLYLSPGQAAKIVVKTV